MNNVHVVPVPGYATAYFNESLIRLRFLCKPMHLHVRDQMMGTSYIFPSLCAFHPKH